MYYSRIFRINSKVAAPSYLTSFKSQPSFSINWSLSWGLGQFNSLILPDRQHRGSSQNGYVLDSHDLTAIQKIQTLIMSFLHLVISSY